MEVKDKVIVVTGGASGIGKSLCERFAMDGAHAVVTADINTAGLSSTLSSIENNTNGLGLQCDVSNEDSVKNLVSVTLREFGHIDLFCSNAGIFTAGGEEVSNDRWKNITELLKTLLPQKNTENTQPRCTKRVLEKTPPQI